MSENDSVEREILLPVPREEAWSLVSEAGHLEAWLAREVELDLREGGEASFRFDGEHERRALVEAVEPPSRLVFRWRPADAGAAGLETIVELRLRDAGAETLLTVTETGFSALPKASACAALGGLGWEGRLRMLRSRTLVVA
jgi:uncharacterized protein YndB with AHSA1/START domain